MRVEWAPWNVSLEQRLQTLAVIVQIFVLMMFGEPICLVLVAVCLFKGHIIVQTLTLAYLVFCYLDRKTPDTGGRGIGSIWFRSLPIWRYFSNYFPVDMVRTAELRPDRNYLFACFPHGLMSFGAVSNFNFENDRWNTLFPGMRSKMMTLDFHFRVPIIREGFLSWGMCSASANSIRTLLSASCDPDAPQNKRDGRTSNAAMVVIGGAQEALHARPGNYTVVLSRRKGFVRLALQTGAPLVPVVSFNEVDIYDQVQSPPGSRTRAVQDWVKRWTGVMPVLFFGRGIFQYTYGLLPLRKRITTVVGAPLEVPKVADPDAEQIEQVHAEFCKALLALFETHKAKYIENAESTHMTIE